MSTIFSHRANFFSLQGYGVDVSGKALLQRVNELLVARPDVSRDDLGRSIKRGKSWISEFFNGKRTTNDLRLVLRMAKFFGVSPGFLINGEAMKPDDALTASLLGVWSDLEKDERDTVLHVALRLRPKRPPAER